MNMDEIRSLVQSVIGEKDWVRGINSQITHQIRVPNKDWSPWISNFQTQKYKFDTNQCSQLSGINNTETQCNYLKATGKFSQAALRWFEENGYIDDETGLFDFSERFTSILSGTTIKGGMQFAYWQTISKYGLLPWKDLHYTLEESMKFNTQEEMCNDYYNPAVITEDMRHKALQSLTWLKIQYEWIGAVPNTQTPINDVVTSLEQAPVHIGIPICNPVIWNTGTVPFCGLRDPMHAVTLYSRSADGSWNIRDHYHPENKVLAPAYYMPLTTLGVISPANISYRHAFLQDIRFGDKGPEVIALQTALAELGYLDKKYITGNYLSITAAAVYKFQVDYAVANRVILFLNHGYYTYLSTRTALNKLFWVV